VNVPVILFHSSLSPSFGFMVAPRSTGIARQAQLSCARKLVFPGLNGPFAACAEQYEQAPGSMSLSQPAAFGSRATAAVTVFRAPFRANLAPAPDITLRALSDAEAGSAPFVLS
jgi:hypothetical protein